MDIFDAEFFVALGFMIFVAWLGYLGIHTKINAALDERGKKISAELDEAKRLRDEAAALLATFERKRAEAEASATSIVAQAKAEAEAFAKQAQVRLNEFIHRRTLQADAKIALAEAEAAHEVRASAADLATAAASQLLQSRLGTSAAIADINESIAALKSLRH